MISILDFYMTILLLLYCWQHYTYIIILILQRPTISDITPFENSYRKTYERSRNSYSWHLYRLSWSFLDSTLKSARTYEHENPDLTEKLPGERAAWRHRDSTRRRRPRRFLTHRRYDEKDSTIRREEGWPTHYQAWSWCCQGKPWYFARVTHNPAKYWREMCWCVTSTLEFRNIFRHIAILKVDMQ